MNPETTLTHNNYSQALLGIPRQEIPEHLTYARNKSLLHTPCIAIVGSRRCTKKGLQTARNIAGYFASRGYTIVSGMAPGIDTAAHVGAMDVCGKTIAILGSSLSYQDLRHPYQESQQMIARILRDGGTVLTEYESGKATTERYKARNRLIVGMSLVTIAVQAERQSGTMNSVHTAVRYRREVWVPRPIESERQHPAYQGIWDIIENRERVTYLKVINSKDDYPMMEERLAHFTEYLHEQ